MKGTVRSVCTLSILALGAAVPAAAKELPPLMSGHVAPRAAAVSGAVPDPSRSYYVPQIGPKSGPSEGPDAIPYFRICPNNDGGSSVPFNARIKLVLRDIADQPISGIAASDICILFNGGTPAQGFSGNGADSIIANSRWNFSPLCPDVRCVSADSATDSRGVTYITLGGADPSNPGVTVRDATRKWGHYDSELPVYALGIQISGRLTSDPWSGSYTLRIKNMDWSGGLDALNNKGEAVTISDFNGIASSLYVNSPVSYWKDLDGTGAVDFGDLSIITAHLNHTCSVPYNP